MPDTPARQAPPEPHRPGPTAPATGATQKRRRWDLPYEWQVGWRYTRAGRGGRRNGFISFISGVSMLGIALVILLLKPDRTPVLAITPSTSSS